MIQHFILTRSDYKGRQDVVNGRREITEQITVPSIQAQTRQDFRWLRTGVDVELNLPVAQPDTFEEHSTADVWWSSCVLPLLNPETTHVLTTRMDDDDALTADFVERLRAKVFETDEPTCYVFPNGIVTDRSKWGATLAHLQHVLFVADAGRQASDLLRVQAQSDADTV